MAGTTDSVALSERQTDTTALQQHLRSATQAAHHRLDHHPLLAPLIRPGLQPAQYGKALQALYACQSAMQAGVAPLWQISANPPPFAAPSRLAALAQDLQQLALAPWPLHNTSAFASASTLPAQIGMLYVLEGATLGGKMIARCVRQQHGEALPLAFFGGEAENPQLRWQAFFEWAQAVSSRDQWEAMAQAAEQTFASIMAHFDACRPL